VFIVPDWENDTNQGLYIWKNHHSLCDGISCMALMLCLDNVYDTKKMIKFPKINIFYRVFLWMIMPFTAVKTIIS